MKIKDFNTDKYSFSDRRFQMLFYQLSHSEMIIRANKKDNIIGKEYDHNIDIYFADVKYIGIPCELNGINFRKGNKDDYNYLKTKVLENFDEDEITVIISEGKEYYIIASVIQVEENDLDLLKLPISNFLH